MGLSTGFKTPIDFEEPILINNNEWEIVNTEPPMELYIKFRGKEPDPDALLRRDKLVK